MGVNKRWIWLGIMFLLVMCWNGCGKAQMSAKGICQGVMIPTVTAEVQTILVPQGTTKPKEKESLMTSETATLPVTEKPSATVVPTAIPTATPTMAPTVASATAPMATPTVAPTMAPTAAPTVAPSMVPTAAPTVTPTATSTMAPTAAPTVVPSMVPTAVPTVAPSMVPTAAPTVAPSMVPIAAPTVTPTAVSTEAPTVAPATHTHSFEKSVWEKPTCQKGGYYNNICSDCGFVECVAQEPLPHDVEDIVIQEGNCMKDTVIQHICKICGVKVQGDTRYTVYDKHNWITEWVDRESITYCEWCGVAK